MKLTGLDAPVASMDDMDLGDERPIFGLMGYGIWDGYQLTLDYAKQEILLERIDSSGNLIGATFNKGKVAEKIPLRMKRHIPIIDLRIGSKIYPMGIDCGANTNLMNNSLEKELSAYIDFESGSENMTGAAGTAEDNRVGFVRDSQVGRQPLHDMYTVFSDQPIGAGKGSDALPVAGLLGTPFLSQQKLTLNFTKGELFFYK